MACNLQDNTYTMGGTPMVQLKRIIPAGGATVYGKIEARNPSFSVKDRIGVAMVEDAIASGALKPGMDIVEPTSGNTGIALAFVGAAKGYKVTLVMPESFSVERRKILKALGATIVLTEKEKGMPGAIAKADEIAKSDTKKYWMPQQFNNPSNPAVHVRTTGPEIWKAMDGKIDAFVSGVGTGGTITGVSQFLKDATRCGKNLLSVAVEPAESPVITQTREGLPIKPSPHPIQGIGAGFVPKVLDLALVDRVEQVAGKDAIAMARRLASEEGIISGVSAGAAVVAAIRIAALPEMKGKNIVVVLPDSGERYLAGILYEFPNIAEAKAGDTL